MQFQPIGQCAAFTLTLGAACLLSCGAAGADASVSAGAGAGVMPDLWAEFQHARNQGHVTTTLKIDNDGLLLSREDGFYTSGLTLTREFVLDGGSGGRNGSVTSYGWRIGQDLYTASDIRLAPERINPVDHPYAGWIHAGVYREVSEAGGRRARYGIDVGCLGPCAGGRPSQTALHRAIGQPLPQGWSRQVRNELGIILHADLVPLRWRLHPAFEVAPGLHWRFGNIHTDVAGSLLMRLGLGVRLSDARPIDASTAGAGWQAFGRLQARAVGYNATLQGGYFSNDNPHVVSPKRLVGEAEAGVRWQRGQFVFSLAVVRVGNEITDLPSRIGAQNFARVQVTLLP